MTMAKRILVPLDGQESSEAIIPLVRSLAREHGSSVRLLRVYPIPERIVSGQGRVLAYVDQEMARLTAAGLDDLRRVEEQLADLPVESIVRFGEPAEEMPLEAEAFGADLIAMATPMRGRLRSALVPGVADRVARKASVPTLVLRTPRA